MFTTKSTLPTYPNLNQNRNRRVLVTLATIAALVLIAEPAAATVLDNFGNALLGILDNTFLRAIAILAVMGTGLMALSGRIEWTKFLTVLLAVVIVFGAAGIVDYIKTNAATAALNPAPLFLHVV